MDEKEMNKPTRPTNRQNRNKTRDKGLLVVGWMTRAVVHGDASTLGMAGLDFIYRYIDPDIRVYTIYMVYFFFWKSKFTYIYAYMHIGPIFPTIPRRTSPE